MINHKLFIFTLTLSVLVILLLLISWFYVLNLEKRAPTVIKNKLPTGGDVNPDNLLLGIGEYDEKQPSSGYDFSTLGQPCLLTSNGGGVPNLPPEIGSDNVYLHKCKPGLICESTTKKGNVCKSMPGRFCNRLSDCSNGANDCINNICVDLNNKTTYKLNLNCIVDDDCNIPGQVSTNFVCDNKLKVCKVAPFPLSNSCMFDTDCASIKNNEMICVLGPSSTANMEVTFEWNTVNFKTTPL